MLTYVRIRRFLLVWQGDLCCRESSSEQSPPAELMPREGKACTKVKAKPCAKVKAAAKAAAAKAMPAMSAIPAIAAIAATEDSAPETAGAVAYFFKEASAVNAGAAGASSSGGVVATVIATASASVAPAAVSAAVVAAKVHPAVGAAKVAPAVVAIAAGPPKLPTATLAEKARSKYFKGAVQIIHIDYLGVSPLNRGKLGISGFHTHRIVSSVRSDGFSRQRYRDATVVKVPATYLKYFQEFNSAICVADPNLPTCSTKMVYALLTKNHLVAALKLFQMGKVTHCDERNIIKPNPNDDQLKHALEDGIACEVLDEKLWLEDEAGVLAIIAEDT